MVGVFSSTYLFLQFSLTILSSTLTNAIIVGCVKGSVSKYILIGLTLFYPSMLLQSMDRDKITYCRLGEDEKGRHVVTTRLLLSKASG